MPLKPLMQVSARERQVTGLGWTILQLYVNKSQVNIAYNHRHAEHYIKG